MAIQLRRTNQCLQYYDRREAQSYAEESDDFQDYDFDDYYAEHHVGPQKHPRVILNRTADDAEFIEDMRENWYGEEEQVDVESTKRRTDSHRVG